LINKEQEAMRKITLMLFVLIMSGTAYAHTLAICNGQYALCAASGASPTGKKMIINGKTFQEGMAVCPVLTGSAIADLDLMNGSCDAKPGTVWSLFGVPTVTSYPQAPDWSNQPAAFRSFVIGNTPQTQISNMWSYLCQIQPEKVNGVTLASCYGPINESPWTHDHPKPGQTGFTQSPANTSFGVGGNAP